MDDKDLQRIAEMVSTVVDSRLGQFRDEIKEELRHRLGMQREDFHHKLDLVVGGQQALVERGRPD